MVSNANLQTLGITAFRSLALKNMQLMKKMLFSTNRIQRIGPSNKWERHEDIKLTKLIEIELNLPANYMTEESKTKVFIHKQKLWNNYVWERIANEIIGRTSDECRRRFWEIIRNSSSSIKEDCASIRDAVKLYRNEGERMKLLKSYKFNGLETAYRISTFYQRKNNGLDKKLLEEERMADLFGETKLYSKHSPKGPLTYSEAMGGNVLEPPSRHVDWNFVAGIVGTKVASECKLEYEAQEIEFEDYLETFNREKMPIDK
jgi:hypothetical protein